MDVLKLLVRRTKRKSINRNVPEYLNSEILKKNIFSTYGGKSIYSVVDFDGTRQEINNGQSIFARTYAKEKFIHYMNRSFIGSFLDFVKTKNRYTQYSYTISDKPKAVGIEITPEKSKNIKKSMGIMIDQFLLRKDHSVKGYDASDMSNMSIIARAIKKLNPDIYSVEKDKSTGRVVREKISRDKSALKWINDNKAEIIEVAYNDILLEEARKLTAKMISEGIELTKSHVFNERINDLIDRKLFPKWDPNTLTKERVRDNSGNIKMTGKNVPWNNIKTIETWEDVKNRTGIPRGDKRRSLLKEEELSFLVKFILIYIFGNRIISFNFQSFHISDNLENKGQPSCYF